MFERLFNSVTSDHRWIVSQHGISEGDLQRFVDSLDLPEARQQIREEFESLEEDFDSSRDISPKYIGVRKRDWAKEIIRDLWQQFVAEEAEEFTVEVA